MLYQRDLESHVKDGMIRGEIKVVLKNEDRSNLIPSPSLILKECDLMLMTVFFHFTLSVAKSMDRCLQLFRFPLIWKPSLRRDFGSPAACATDCFTQCRIPSHCFTRTTRNHRRINSARLAFDYQIAHYSTASHICRAQGRGEVTEALMWVSECLKVKWFALPKTISLLLH